MSRITDYSFLFENMFGNRSSSAIGSFKLSEVNSGSVQAKLKAAGIDINSKQYKAVLKEMMNAGGNGDTTKRSVVYTNIQRKVTKNDRLAATYTMNQYERQYRKAFITAVKASDPSWELGKPIKPGVLENITRESVEGTLKKSGNTIDYSI